MASVVRDNGKERENTDREEQKENPSIDARPTEAKGEAAPLVSKSKHGGSSSNTTREEISIRECSSNLSARSAAPWQGVVAQAENSTEKQPHAQT